MVMIYKEEEEEEEEVPEFSKSQKEVGHVLLLFLSVDYTVCL